MKTIIWVRWAVFAVVLLGLAIAFQHLSSRLPKAAILTTEAGASPNPTPTLKVMTYASFMSSWGPGPEIAKLFKEKTGKEVEFIDAGDAGLLLKKLELFPADVVIGLDQLLLKQAQAARQWKPVSGIQDLPGERLYPNDTFLAIDWGPMAFIYREGEIDPPKSLDDLLDARFKSSLALQDPRTSTPGLQFFFWVLDEKGIDGGFAYLEKLKGNVQTVADSWSKSYGAFTKKQAKLGFSYLTSPVYHWTQDKDRTYRPAVFFDGHPIQIEYLGIPATCQACGDAEVFAKFMLEPQIQAIVMNKNFMYPVIKSVRSGTPFDELPRINGRDWKNLDELNQRREELFERWRKLGL